MRSDIPQLAQDLGADERTLRRAVTDGLVRCQRPSPRRVHLTHQERSYLARHWDLLASLRQALRTEPRVRLALLYGSVARGDDGPDSDVDLLVKLADGSVSDSIALAVRLERKVGREIDIARFEQVDADSPLLLLSVLDEGRVLVDRDGLWPRLRAGRASLARRADASFARQLAGAREAIERLTKDGA